MFVLYTIPFKVLMFFFTWFEVFRIYASSCFHFFHRMQGNSAM